MLAQAGEGERPLDVAALASGREAFVEIAPPGGAPWRGDLLRSAASAAGRPWQSGPLVVNRRVSLPVPPEAVGGVASFRLVADVSLRADGTLWVDAWFRNDGAMRPGGGTASYRARVMLDGREALREDLAAHHQYRGWGRLLGAARGGRVAGAAPNIRHDLSYLAESGATARYDATTGVAEEVLARMGSAIAGAAWNAPLGTRYVTPYMPTGGGRFDIGPTTGWQAAWLISGDPRAAAFCIGQAEACGTIPWHFWDATGGAEGSGGWLDAVRWPNLWTDGRGGRPPRGLAQQIPSDTGWTLDTAHQPTLAFVPYLLTGRRAFADEVMAVGAWNVVGQWPAVRARPEGPRGRRASSSSIGSRRAVRPGRCARWTRLPMSRRTAILTRPTCATCSRGTTPGCARAYPNGRSCRERRMAGSYPTSWARAACRSRRGSRTTSRCR
ncbi:hypothetical protein ACE7GA_14585 [Roseomonas sp. CCTCC AB2023176]|uniref:hypothetical protein n=1 Tax=Roseomonas sp. CCTCC AB2023176 TaxID=3342640 RepID=UPI0035DEFB87